MSFILPSKSGYLPGTTNARTSAIETMRLTNVKQNMLNNLSGGNIKLPSFHDSMPYKPNGTNPANLMVSNAVNTMQNKENATDDHFAAIKGGRRIRTDNRRRRVGKRQTNKRRQVNKKRQTNKRIRVNKRR